MTFIGAPPHKGSHQSGGGDAIKLDDLLAPDDNTDLNALITKHGLLPKLSNVITQFLNGLGDWATPPSLVVAETEVFNGEAPATWTDLDINAVVGANAALAILKVQLTDNRNAAFRKNGDTDEFYTVDIPSGAPAYGASLIVGDSDGSWKTVLVATDGSGIIEWKSGGSPAIVKTIAHIK